MMAPVTPRRIGFIGLGGMGRRHLQIISGLPTMASVAALCDIDAERVAELAQSHGSAEVFTDPEACARDAKVDGFVIASDDESHYSILSDCLRREVPVLCEKPMTSSASQAWHLTDREAKLGRRLIHVGFMRRFDPEYAWIRSMSCTGALGRPLTAVGRHRMPTGAANFGAEMLVASSATHDIDAFRWLTREEVTDVACESSVAPEEGAATVMLTMRSESGVLGVFELTAAPACPYEVTFEVIGTAGTATTGIPPAASRAADTGVGRFGPADWIERFAAAYYAQAVAWLITLETGSWPSATAWDGYANSVVVAAATQALATRERVAVDLAHRGGSSSH